MERFDLTLVARGMECWEELAPEPEGDYCLYSEVAEERETFVARIRALEEALANALQAQARFVPCSERFPPDDKERVVGTAGGGIAVAAYIAPTHSWILRTTLGREGIVSWLDNLPPLDGSVRIKGE